MAKLTIIDIPLSQWEDEGFYNIRYNLLAIREDVTAERREELITQFSTRR